MNQLTVIDNHSNVASIMKAESVDELCRSFTKRELAEFIIRRTEGWRKSAKANERSLAARIGEKIEYKRDTACWIWKGATNGAGYGQIGIGRRKMYAHRAAYEIARGPIPSNMVLDHLCRNPSCVSPAHLEAVTNRENTMRGKVSALRHLRSAK